MKRAERVVDGKRNRLCRDFLGYGRSPSVAHVHMCDLMESVVEKPKLLDRVKQTLRARHHSRRTEEAYVAWIRRFILFHGKRHPSTMSGEEVNRFLSHLASECDVSASTQNQALCALLFLYGPVLGEKLDWVEMAIHAKRPARLPVVLTREEVKGILSEVRGTATLIAKLLYGSGLRLNEALTEGQRYRFRTRRDSGARRKG